ncbi:5-oxoprolinase subunit PxpB [Gaetbulibacter jejuensis]|uniref:5-oxoprolinase subunit PxpB n=1 Tax=Gaetbulibacter jejuensis TaxID=584607 RepID=UPI00300AD840
MDFNLKYKAYGERSILIEWPNEINEIILEDVLIFKNSIADNYIKELVEINNAYNSILIICKFTIDNINDEILALKSIYFNRKKVGHRSQLLWKIPVCYDAFFGIDLEEISAQKRLSKSAIIKLHSQAIYTVFFVGFLPGFLYLGGLDNQLHFSRKSSPRMEVKKGAVAIGEYQTGIYPNASPGGWNIIGNSPIDFFDVSKDEPCFAKSGDKIQFYPISLNEHKAISELVVYGDYELESEVING